MVIDIFIGQEGLKWRKKGRRCLQPCTSAPIVNGFKIVGGVEGRGQPTTR